jgi:flagellar biosynthesis protein FlhF
MMQKTFFAEDMRKALRLVRDDMGAEAIILANKKVPGGVEVAAAINTEAASSVQPVKVSAKAGQSSVGKTQVIANSASSNVRKSEQLDKLKAQRAVKEAQLLKAVAGDKIQAVTQAVSKDEESSSRSVVSAYEYYNTSTRKEIQSEKDAHSSSQSSHDLVEPESTLDSTPDELDVMTERYENELAEVRKQLESLKSTLDKSQAQPDPQVMRVKQQTSLKLTHLGFSQTASEHLSQKMPDAESEAIAWKNALTTLSEEVESDQNTFDARHGCFSFIGSPGVGKTTLITKLAIEHIQKYGREDLVLVTLDNQRLGASQQIIHLGQLLQVPVFVGDKAERLISKVEQAGRNKKILIDTAGVTAIDDYWLEQVHLLKKLPESSKTILVVSCTQQLAVLNAMVQDYLLLDVSGAVLTKADEATSIAEALSIVVENKLPVCAISHSQKTSLPLLKLSGAAIVDMLVNKSRRWSVLNDISSLATQEGHRSPGGLSPSSEVEGGGRQRNVARTEPEDESINACVD